MSGERDAALEFLQNRINYEQHPSPNYTPEEFKLARMRELLARLDDPQQRYPIVHVAGTKGKGSTCAMLAAMAAESGYRCGLYTSPHLQTLEERFRINGVPCTEAELVQLAASLRPVAEEMDAEAHGRRPRRSAGGRNWDRARGGPTFFELTTAIAFLHFARRNVDLAIVEVGMGGRLDSTNVCQPDLCIITSISFDHTRQLGNTLSAIAREKAGIIKPGVAVISGVLHEEPRDVVRATCAERAAPLAELNREFFVEYQPPHDLQAHRERGVIRYRRAAQWQPTPPGARDDFSALPLEIGLPGLHQAQNAALALAAADVLRGRGWRLRADSVADALRGLRWPARVEVVHRRPTVIIDAAHNVASIQALLHTLRESFRARRRVLVFGTSRDKDVDGMLRLLAPSFDKLILTRYLGNPRGVPAQDLAARLPPLAGAVHVCPDPAAAWNEAASDLHSADLVCVTGSFFLAAEVQTEFVRWKQQARDVVAE